MKITPPPPSHVQEAKHTDERKQRYEALGGLRGTAAVIVAFIWHYQHFKPESFPFSGILYLPYAYGWVMVELFFMLSGFIFFNKYGKEISEHSLSKRDFFILRFSRLYPLHWLTLFIVITVKFVLKRYTGSAFFVYHNNNIFFFLQNILCIQNGWLQTDFSFNGPAWSISVEIMMYIVFYTLFYHVRNGKTSLIACLFLIYTGLMMYTSGWNKPVFNDQIGVGLMCFFIGCVTGKLLNYCKTNIKLERLIICASIFVILALSVIVMVYRHEYLIFMGIFLFFPAALIVSLRIRIISSILSLKPLLYLGEISYSIYLMHFPIQLIIITIAIIFDLKINYSSGIFFFIFILTVITASHIVHYCFEKPVQNFIRNRLMIKAAK
ncbi:MAG: acyltransferase [Spirochaetaceae bacterium]|jgi:peptidoglycan/LPS O-acetylase OafA/YrhL|nr:acyltransferase [Spirochaetaceae bacterium]